MKSKLKGFDKLGAWPTHVNFQPDNKRQPLSQDTLWLALRRGFASPDQGLVVCDTFAYLPKPSL